MKKSKNEISEKPAKMCYTHKNRYTGADHVRARAMEGFIYEKI